MKCFSGNTINYIDTIMHALFYNIERVGLRGLYNLKCMSQALFWDVVDDRLFFSAAFMLLKC